MTRLPAVAVIVAGCALALAPAAFANSNITIVSGSTLTNNAGAPTFAPTGAGSQVGADLIANQLNAGTNVVLDTTSGSGDPGAISVTAAVGSIGTGNLTLDADAGVSQTAGGTLTVHGLTINAVNGVALGGINTPTLTVTAGDPITQTGPAMVSGTTTVTTNTTDSVTLTNAANDFGILSSGQVGALSVTDANGITLGSVSANGALSVTAAGSITQTGALVATNAATFTAGAANNITLTNSGNNLSAFGVVSANNVSLTTSASTALTTGTISGNLTVAAPGGISQTGAVSVLGTTTLNAGSQFVSLPQAGNDWGGTVVISAANNASIRDMNSLTLGASTVTGGLTAVAGGPLIQTGALTVPGNATVTGTHVVLANAGNDFGGQVAVSNTGATAATITDANDLSLGNSSSAGALTVIAGGDLTVPAAKTVGATGDLVLIADNQNPTFPAIGSGGLTVGAGAALTGTNVRLYAAHRADNTIDPSATFNGATFTPGTLFVPSNRERWGVYASGGSATAPFTFFYKDNDTTLPTVTVRSPTSASQYTVGDVVSADYECADNSSVASCSGPVANGAAIDTASPGTKTFTVTATDAAGNSFTRTITYAVVAAPAPVTTTPPAENPPASPPPVVKESPHAVVTVKSRTAKLRRGRHPQLVTGLVVTCPKGLPSSCGGSGRVTANVPKNLATGVVTIGKLGFAVRPGTSHTVVIQLTPRGVRIVERVKSVRVTLQVTTRGLDGKRVVSTQRVTLRIR